MKGTGYVIRRYESGDETAIADLFNKVFGPADPEFQPRDAQWWRWKYARNPAGSHTLVVEDPDGRVVAHYGGVPLRVRADGREYRFGQNCDAYSDPTIRRGLRNPGLFVRLAQAYASTFGGSHEDVVMYGLPVPDHYRVGVRYLDYWMLRSQMMLVCRDGARLPEWAPAMHAIPVTSFPSEMDECFERQASIFGCMAVRDSRFLNWRFTDAPGNPYRMAISRPGEGGAVRGYVVYRNAKIAARPYGVIVDWMLDPCDTTAGQSLLRWAAERAAQDGHRELAFICPTSSPWFAQFQDWGFEAEPTPYVMTARPYHQKFEPEYLRRHWYYTLADFDLV